MSARQRSAGFTLIEILVALGLMALLFTLAFGVLRGMRGTIGRGEALINRNDEVRLAQTFLRRQLSHSMGLPFERLDDSGLNKIFEADGERIRFVAPMPGYLAAGGPHVQTLEIERGDDGFEILFQHELLNGFDPDESSDDARPPIRLLGGMSEAHFEFRGLEDDFSLSDWSEDWDDPQKMPLLVRVVAEFDSDARRQRWPVLEIPLLVATGFSGSGGGIGSIRPVENYDPDFGAPLPPGNKPEQ